MKNLEEIFKDYAFEPVPKEKLVSGWHIGLIYIGVGLTLPAFLMASEIGLNLGFSGSILGLFIASLILTGAAMLTGYIGGATRLSTYRVCRIAFGRYGAKLVNLTMAAATFGWFGVTCAFFAEATNGITAEQIGLNIGQSGWIVIGTVLMVSTAIFGFKGLDKLSLIVVPLLLTLMAVMVFKTTADISFNDLWNKTGSNDFSCGTTISMIVGGWMVGVTVLPDLTRYARTPLHGAGAAIICFIVGLFAVFLPNIIIALATGEKNIVDVILSFGWVFIALTTVILSSWSSNDNNLYSASLGLASVLEKFAKWKIVLIAGSAGGILGVLGILDQFIPFLIFLGVIIPPIAGVYIADFFVNRAGYDSFSEEALAPVKIPAFVSWVTGTTVAYMTLPAVENGLGVFTLTTIPALDALLVSSFLHAGLCVMLKRKKPA